MNYQTPYECQHGIRQNHLFLMERRPPNTSHGLINSIVTAVIASPRNDVKIPWGSAQRTCLFQMERRLLDVKSRPYCYHYQCRPLVVVILPSECSTSFMCITIKKYAYGSRFLVCWDLSMYICIQIYVGHNTYGYYEQIYICACMYKLYSPNPYLQNKSPWRIQFSFTAINGLTWYLQHRDPWNIEFSIAAINVWGVIMCLGLNLIAWKRFVHYLPFTSSIHQWAVDSPHKGPAVQIFCFLCVG